MTIAGPRGARPDRQDDGGHATATRRSRRATCTSAPGRAATTSTATTGSSPYTFELSVRDYPDDSQIAAETGRNKEAVLYLMERAWCPLSVRGAAVTDGSLRRLRRRPRGLPRLDREPGRDRHGAVDRPASRASNPAATASQGPKQLGTTPSGCDRASSPAPRPDSSQRQRPRRATTDPLAIDRAARRRRPAADVRLRVRPRRHVQRGRHASARSSSGRTARRSRSSGSAGRAADVDGVWRTASVSMDPLRRPDDPPSVRGDRRRPGQPRSRSSSTTSG